MSGLSFFGILISDWLSAAVAFGTISLALVTYMAWGQAKEQLKVMRRQLILSQREKDPLLQVVEKKYIKDSIQLKIKNIGAGNACQIAILTSFCFLKNNENIAEGQRTWLNWEGVSTITMDGKKYTSTPGAGYISFGASPKIIKPGEMKEVMINPKFMFKTGNSLNFQAMDWPGLKEYMENNEIEAVNLFMVVIYKNIMEEIKDYAPVGDFIFELKKHDSLEKAFTENIKVSGIHPFPFDDIEWLPFDFYKNAKSLEDLV